MNAAVRSVMIVGGAGLAIALSVGCGGGKKPEQGPPPVPVVVATVRSETMPLNVDAIGNVVPSTTVSVQAQVTGLLQQVHFHEGDEVTQGQLLFTIDQRPFENDLHQAEAQLAKDRAQLANAEAQLARYAELVKEDFVTKEQYDEAKATADSLQATIEQDQAAVANARVNLGYCTITAPITGRTGELLVDAGNLVEVTANTRLVVINAIRPIDVTFSVPERHLGAIRQRQARAPLPVTAHPEGEPAVSAAGVLRLIDNTVDTSTGTILLKARFANRDEALWPGQFVDVVLQLGEQAHATVIPTQAVQAGQQGHYVFVVGANDTAEMRSIVIDRTVGEETVVSSGVSPGETVVVQGQLMLRPGATVTIATPTPGPSPSRTATPSAAPSTPAGPPV